MPGRARSCASHPDRHDGPRTSIHAGPGVVPAQAQSRRCLRERLLQNWRRIDTDPEGYLRRTLYNLAADGWRRQGRWRGRLAELDPSTYFPVLVIWNNRTHWRDGNPLDGTVREDIRLLPPPRQHRQGDRDHPGQLPQGAGQHIRRPCVALLHERMSAAHSRRGPMVRPGPRPAPAGCSGVLLASPRGVSGVLMGTALLAAQVIVDQADCGRALTNRRGDAFH